MTILAIELQDRALALASEGRVLSCEPSVVFDGSGGRPAGAPAWSALRLLPTLVSSRHFTEIAAQPAPRAGSSAVVAAELRRRLDAISRRDAQRVWIAAPASCDARALGTVLGIARSLALPVEGFVDAATVSVAALGIRRTALVLELGLHHVAITAVESDREARRRRAVVSGRGGLLELYDAWLDLISTVMVRRTRFDPLHEAATEQQLFDALPALAREAALAGSATAAVGTGDRRFETPLTRDQLTEAAQPVYREALRLLHELRPAGAPVTVLVPQAAVTLPGLREALEQFADCELVAVADGHAAAATSLLGLPDVREGATVPLLRRLPVAEQPALAGLAAAESLGERRAQTPPPSHVLFEGRAIPLAHEALVVGRAPAAPNAIALAEGLAGVSRRHCTFVRNGEEIVLVDHSSCGTFVNGERVAERVRVRAGDRVRIGEPGVQLELIAVGEAFPGNEHGAAQA